MEGNHNPQDSNASFPVEKEGADVFATERTDIGNVLANAEQSGIPSPPPFDRRFNEPPPLTTIGLPEEGTPVAPIEDDTTLVYEAPKINQPSDEVVSRTLQIGGGKVTTPEKQLTDNFEYIKNKFPVGSVIKCDADRKVANDETVTLGVVVKLGQDENGIFAILSWLSPKGLKGKGDFSVTRLLELNKGTRDVKEGLIKNPNDEYEIDRVLRELKSV